MSYYNLISLMPKTAGIDPDAQAFITAAAITNPTQQAAINTLVVDLKGYSIWTKMKALYPFVGGTASAHKFNLKNPLDTNAAFRILWNGGVTHSSNGVQFGGVNGFGNTNFIPSTVTAQNSFAFGLYSRTNTDGVIQDMGSTGDGAVYDELQLRNSNEFKGAINSTLLRITSVNTNSQGFYTMSRTAANTIKNYKNGTLLTTAATSSLGNVNAAIYIGGFNNQGGLQFPSNRQYSFNYISDGLTDTEAANFYTAVQAFQTTLGRSIGTQTVSDPDAQAFVTAADIQDQVEANAINNLVIGLKADGLWTKMQAVYPFVGSSSSSNSYNLKNTAQYQLSFSGGGTWNSNGYTGGVNGYANTGLNPNTAFSTNNSMHLSLYSRTNNSGGFGDFGILNASALTTLNVSFSGNASTLIHGGTGVSTANTNSTGFYVGTRTSASVLKLFKNNTQLGSTYTGANGVRGDLNMFLGALNVSGTAQYYTQRNYAFASIGDGLTDTDATNLNTRVTTFQTALNRNI